MKKFLLFLFLLILVAAAYLTGSRGTDPAKWFEPPTPTPTAWEGHPVQPIDRYPRDDDGHGGYTAKSQAPTSPTVTHSFTWIVGGKPYEFCCPPCVDEFLKTAKQNPTALKNPDEYVKTR